MATANGTPVGVDRSKVDQILTGQPLTTGYTPTMPDWAYFTSQAVPPIYLLQDLELMLIHPIVLNALNYFKGAIAGAEFVGPPDPNDPMGKARLPVSQDPAVTGFVLGQCRRYWDRGVPKVQHGYEYGWQGCENLFGEEQGVMAWTGLLDFSPRDTFLLTQDERPVGIRVKNVSIPEDDQRQPPIDLWTASRDIPAKGLWYAHNPRYNRYYGRSQLLGAWRPWRRLAWKDAAETVLDGGFYRLAYRGPTVRFPEKDVMAPAGSAYTQQNSQGQPMRPARDVARQMAEQAKAGASTGLPSTKYPNEMGGGYEWEFDWGEVAFNGEPLLAYVQYLISQIREGIGVPNELIEAAESGSGYSGRAIPLEGFFLLQQRIADALLRLFVEQVLRPLVRWNFGDVPFEVSVKSLLETKLAMRMAQGGAPPENQAGAPPAIPGQPGAEPVAQEPMQTPQSGMPFSITPEVRDRARQIAEAVLKRRNAA